MPNDNSSQENIQKLLELADKIEAQLTSLPFSMPRRLPNDLLDLKQKIKTIKRYVGQLESERQELLGLAEIGKVINSSLKLNDVLRIVMDTLIRLTEAERGFLMLRDQDTNKLTTQIARNWEQESLAPDEFAVSQTVINRVAERGEPILTTNA